MADGLQFADVKAAQTAPGFNLANAAQAATIGSPTYTPPNPSVPVPGSQIVNGSGLNFSPAIPNDNGHSVVQGIIAGQNYSNPPVEAGTPSLDQATNQYNQSVQNYTNLTNGSPPDESKMYTDISNAAGLPGQKTQIDQLKTELATLTAGYNNQYQQIGATGVEQGIPSVFYQGEQAAQQRQASTVIAGKAAVLAAMQGNYNEAETLAKQTADMQFKAAEDRITNAYNFLKLNQDTLTKAQANTIKTQADQEKTQVADQKANVKTALTSGVQTEFWTDPSGTVIRTSDGYKFHNPQEAFAAGVLQDFSNAPKIQPVGKSETKKINGINYHIVYDQAGNVLSKTNLGNSASTLTTPSGKLPAVPARQTEVSGYLKTKAGQDGFISPKDWSTAMDAWVSSGYGTTNSFKSTFANFKNPADPKDYK